MTHRISHGNSAVSVCECGTIVKSSTAAVMRHIVNGELQCFAADLFRVDYPSMELYVVAGSVSEREYERKARLLLERGYSKHTEEDHDSQPDPEG